MTDCHAGDTDDAEHLDARLQMVERQLCDRGITDSRVLEAFRKVPRHRFASADCSPAEAHGDHPLPISCGQTVSQPYVVGVMLQALKLAPRDWTLEIGTGSGYQTALLAEMVDELCTVEYHDELAQNGRRTLGELQYVNITYHVGDGARGWPHKPGKFDAIIASAAPLEVPSALVDQLSIGGRMILPVGGLHQYLLHLRRTPTGIERSRSLPVRFVPMIQL